MIEDLMKHLKMTFTNNKELVDELFRSPFLEDSEEINNVIEIREQKQQVTVTRLYQWSIAAYQLSKFCMLELYYNFVEKCLD